MEECSCDLWDVLQPEDSPNAVRAPGRRGSSQEISHSCSVSRRRVLSLRRKLKQRVHQAVEDCVKEEMVPQSIGRSVKPSFSPWPPYSHQNSAIICRGLHGQHYCLIPQGCWFKSCSLTCSHCGSCVTLCRWTEGCWFWYQRDLSSGSLSKALKPKRSRDWLTLLSHCMSIWIKRPAK